MLDHLIDPDSEFDRADAAYNIDHLELIVYYDEKECAWGYQIWDNDRDEEHSDSTPEYTIKQQAEDAGDRALEQAIDEVIDSMEEAWNERQAMGSRWHSEE